jgi:hypothetical protein
VEEAAAFSSRTVGEHGAVVLDHGKSIFRGSVGPPKHVLHASTQEEHRASTLIDAKISLWCMQRRLVRRWKAPSVETVGKFSVRPVQIVGAIPFNRADKNVVQDYTS